MGGEESWLGPARMRSLVASLSRAPRTTTLRVNTLRTTAGAVPPSRKRSSRSRTRRLRDRRLHEVEGLAWSAHERGAVDAVGEVRHLAAERKDDQT